ncbi:MAG TPA: flippase activity-associated protein Agl23 [Candidatus Kapabacteria bacterium]|nr:flippase activity-associated protein Agl23 [Candidatus Kapabacteria bacterium]
MKWWSALAVLLIFAGALAFRLPKLDARPLHNDEAVNAIKVTELWQEGRYRYDPDEYHGPTLHYTTAPFLTLSGASNANEVQDSTLRLATVFFGAAIILLFLLFRDALGTRAILWSAIFAAVSPAMVFYSRYFIHEMLLVFFTALAIGAGWRYVQTRSIKWAITSGVALGLMVATKETFVLSVAAMVPATVVAFWPRIPKPISLRNVGRQLDWKGISFGLAASFIVWFLFFSSFLTNFHGLIDSVLTYVPWIKRAAGESPHLHPWYFYLQRLAWFHPVKGPVWSEALILILALVGTVISFRRNQSPVLRFVATYTIALTAIYSVISYKTPWCLLNFYIGMILLAGVGAVTLVGLSRQRFVQIFVAVMLLAGTVQLAMQSWRASITYAFDRRNPYVYAQTVPDILKLVKRAEGLAQVSPAGFETIVKVISPQSDYWPLPWYLRRFKQIGWYEKIPDDPFAPIIIVSAGLDARLDEKSERKWIMAGMTELRPTKFFELYVELELWKKYVETLPPEPD